MTRITSPFTHARLTSRGIAALLAASTLGALAAAADAQILIADGVTLETGAAPDIFTGGMIQDLYLRPEFQGIHLDGSVRKNPPHLDLAGNPFEPSRVSDLGGINLATGTYDRRFVDLPGAGWTHARDYNARQHDGTSDYDSTGPQGKNWAHTSQPELDLAFINGNGRIVIHWGGAYYVFKPTGASEYIGVNGTHAVLATGSNNGVDYWILWTPRGDNVYFFNPADSDAAPAAGQFWKHVYPDGVRVVYAGDASNAATAITDGYYDSTDPDTEGKIKSVTDLDGFEFAYTYNATTGQLTKVERKNGSGTVIDQVEYTYYSGTGNSAIDGNLKLVTRTTDLSDSAETLVQKSYYRYNTSGLLAMVVDPEGYRRADLDEDGLLDDDPLNEATITDAELKPYTIAHFTEYSDRKITKVYFNGQCGCSGGDNGEMVITYSANGSFSDTEGTYDQNNQNWQTRTIVDPSSTLVDADTLYYFDDVGQSLSTVRRTDLSGTIKNWVTKVTRNSDGAVTQIATPAALDTYTHSTGAITTSNTGGLIHNITRTTGAVALRGFATATGYQTGLASDNTLLTETTYSTRDKAFSVTAILKRPYLSSRKVYEDEHIGYTTTYTPTFSTGEMLPDKIVTTMPTVTTAKNGSNSALTSTTYFDDNGRVTFTKSADGTISYKAYDDTGRVLDTVQDADVTLTGTGEYFENITIPTGLANTGTPLHFVTTRSYDELGRLYRVAEPNDHVTEHHLTRLADQRPVSIVVPLVDTSGTTTYHGPASYTVSNQAGRTELSATIAITAGTTTTSVAEWIDESKAIDGTTKEVKAAYALNTSPNFASEASITRIGTTVYDETGQRVDETRTYFDIPAEGTWPGSDDTHYDRTAVVYDELGRRQQVTDATDTIRFTAFDDLERPISAWVGTDATGATNASPGGSGTNDLIKISETVYDSGGVGNGDVTKTTAFVQDSATGKRETTYLHDDFGRVGLVTRPVQPKYTVNSYNLRGAVLMTAQFKGTTPPSGTSNRVAFSKNFYDEWGRLYESRTYEINQGTGAVVQSGSPLEDNYLANLTWYDEVGRVAKTVGRYVTKNEYDRLGRLTDTYTLDQDRDADYAEALEIQTGAGGDVVVEQRKTVYENSTSSDDFGRVLMSVSYERTHDETTTSLTGPLDTNADSDNETVTMSNVDAFVQISAMWYDALGRNTTAAEYGTNGGSNFSYSSTAPTASSATVMVRQTTYHPDGSLKESIQVGDGSSVADVKMRYDYDDAGRQITTIQNDTAANPPHGTANRDEDLYTRTEYADGMVKETWLDVDGDGTKDATDQRTIYTYGVVAGTVPADSLVTRNDLLNEVQYPGHTISDPDMVRYEYNALGERIVFIDQAENVHQYVYDDGGRLTDDKATTVKTGLGFSNWVERITTAYDDRGMASTVTQYDDPAAGNVVNQLEYEYDNYGTLESFAQDNDSVVNAGGGTPTYATSYSFDPTEHRFRVLAEVDYPDGSTIQYGFTGMDGDLGRPTDITADSGSTVVAVYEYTGLSRVVSAELPEPQMTNRLYDLFNDYVGMDQFGRIQETLWEAGSVGSGAYLVDLSYEYDVRGNNDAVVNLVHTDAGGRVEDRRYTIDDLGRIVGEERGQWSGTTLSNSAQDQDWGFDQMANWATHDDTGATLDETRTHNLGNELIARDTNSDSTDDFLLDYDANGNLVENVDGSSDGTTYVYDAWNRLVNIIRLESGTKTDTLAVYTYDGLGRRISWLEDTDDDGDADASDNQMNLALDASGKMLNTYDESNDADTPIERFVYHVASPAIGGAGSSAVLLRDRESGWTTSPDGTLDQRHYYLPDAHGNVAAVVTDAHVQVEQVTYDWRGMPFNHPRGDSDADGDVDDDDFPQSFAPTCDLPRDVDLDGDCDTNDRMIATNTKIGGYGVLSFEENGNRYGYQMLQIAYTVSPVLYFDIGCVYDVVLGRGYRSLLPVVYACPTASSAGATLTVAGGTPRQLPPMVIIPPDPEEGCTAPLPETPTDQECCDAIRKAPCFNGAGGGVVCCNGRKVSCSWIPNHLEPGWYVVHGCVLEHEDTHHDDIDCSKCESGHVCRPPFSPDKRDPGEQDVEECAAYIIEITCLHRRKSECDAVNGYTPAERQTCWQRVEQRIKQICDGAEQKCGWRPASCP